MHVLTNKHKFIVPGDLIFDLAGLSEAVEKEDYAAILLCSVKLAEKFKNAKLEQAKENG